MKKLVSLALIFICFGANAQKQIVIQGVGTGLYLEHTVTPNESFLKLASLYNLSPNRIATFNSLSLSHSFITGSTLKIPLGIQNFEQRGQKGTYEVLVPLYHLTTSNESLNSISTRYNNVSVDLIKEWNKELREPLVLNSKIIVGHLRVKSSLANVFGNTNENVAATKETTSPAKTETPAKTEGTTTPSEQPKPVVTEDYSKYDSDELLELAKTAAFEKKNYPLAIILLHTGLAKSPEYPDLRIFLGRIYTWTDKLDSARKHFEYVIATNPSATDVYVAYADLEYWNDRNAEALRRVNQGLIHHTQSKELLLRKAKILNSTGQLKEARKVLDTLLTIDPRNADARALSGKLRDIMVGDRIGVSYDYVHFDKQFDAPWHLVSLEYTRQTPIGSAGLRLNYANRFKSNGSQYEFEAYPGISTRFYSYVSFAYSDDVGVFPKYRGGFSLYASLPKSFEGELGFRYLKFTDETWIYTAAVGKYYKNWLFNARTYLTPGIANISQSYNVGARYYYGGAFDFIGLVLGRGISPDERPASILLNSDYRLQSEKVMATFKHELNNKHIVTLTADWINTEYLPKTRGNQIEAGIFYQVRL